MISKLRLIKYIILFYLLLQSSALSEVIKKIEVKGNERISSDTIIMFTGVNLNQNIDDDKLNKIIKRLYDTNFFKNISAEIKSNFKQVPASITRLFLFGLIENAPTALANRSFPNVFGLK